MTAKTIISRLLQMVIVLIGISFITFALTYLAPGDPVQAMFSATGVMPTTDVLDQMREDMGLNEPLLVQYWNWLTSCLQGDFGTSYQSKQPVVAMLLARLWPTIKLALLSLVIMLVFAVPMGILSAVYQNKPIDYIVRALTFFGVSVPNFWVGLILIMVFAVNLKIFPVISSGGDLMSLILPACTLAFAMTAKYTRQVRTAVLEELHQDYVIGARARGVPERKILWGNVLPNSMLPLITLLGLSMGSLLGGTAVVEVIFSYPGLGNLAVSSITAYDYPVIQGYVLWVAVIYMVINLVVDFSYGFIDPRIRLKR
ncbi:MAG: ABC transporter permease [Eggerthellaceae bacterium]|nr:ABC transporter permease [Eggerthellaceae bacterium]